MKVGFGAFRRGALIGGCACLAAALSLAQNSLAQSAAKPAPTSAAGTRTLLAGKAHALEARGRPDLSIQLWQQILLSDPNNVEALAGLARDLKLTGSDKSIEALDRLRKVSPNSPEIAKIEALASTRAEAAQLRQAGELARQGKPDEAMRLYRQLYGEHPPDGDIALAYYQTLYGTAGGKQEALANMRALAQRNPGDPRFAVALGTMLTYDARSRAEGVRLLREHPQDAAAQAALRQALVWDASNPSSAAELRAYLKDHPADTELADRLKEDESKLAKMNSGIARTPAERAAFAALNAKHLDEAEKRFAAILEAEPGNGRAAAGMGFLRMQQSNFADAVTYLERAEANDFKDASVENGLATSRFWLVMGEASEAFRQNQLEAASAKYQQALTMRPHAPEALNGLAGLLTRQQQYAAAAELYDELVKVQPASTDGWRGLFLACARANQDQKALAVEARMPAPVKTALNKDPDYLHTLAGIYQAENRTADAQRVLALALTLPFPDNGATLKAETKAEYAAILVQARRFDQAINLYLQMVADDAGNASAWEGLVSAQHEMGQDTVAIAEVQKMPPAVYEAALADPGFLSMLGAIYQQANQFEVAQGLLERAAKLETAAGGQPGAGLQLQLAGIYLRRNDTERAYGIYQHVLQTSPGRADAWKGLLAALAATHRETEALQEIAQIPPAVRKELDADIEFIQTEASLYAATGDTAHAVEFMNRVQAHYAKLHAAAPAAIEIQNAWLLLNTGNDRELYPALMRLGARTELTSGQRETVQDIWANWSVRRAAAAMENGSPQRSVDILDAASQAFPNNLTVRKAVAGGYAQVGRAKEALALFKTVPMQDASGSDFQAAVGAALAANDKAQAELWLRQALERFPHDPAVLAEAARYEQARGDNQRAADYYRASLAAMPAVSPTEKLAHTLVYPDDDTHVHKAVTAADLQRLLDPSNEPFARITQLPALPAYGTDPYGGVAPVVVAPAPPAQQPAMQPGTAAPAAPANQDQPQIYPPSANRGKSTPAPIYVPQAWHRDRPRPDGAPGMQGAWRTVPRTQGRPELVYLTLRVDRRARLRQLAGGPVQLETAGPWQRAIAMVSTVRPGSGAPADADREAEPPAAAPFGSAQTAAQNQFQAPELSANAPHSQASDAWKGLVFSLMASRRNAEALDEMAKIPADIRQQLEADLEFVQAEAGLYVAAGDLPSAASSLKRIESFYIVHRDDVPANLEVQHAWLLFDLGNDGALYAALQRLDARAGMAAGLREQTADLWANFALRRADLLRKNGEKLRCVQILQAASENFPGNLALRRALAGAYMQIGRPAAALELFKTLPLEGAGAADYQGAIGAALAATDMAQAEQWLRVALASFPKDPQILAQAARFEQARGNAARAAEFWRASIAAMPAGAAAAEPESSVAASALPKTGAAEMKRLLAPETELAAKAPGTPASGRNSTRPTPGAPAAAAAGAPVFPPLAGAAPPAQLKSRASAEPLPLPGAQQGTNTASSRSTGLSLASPQSTVGLPHSSSVHTGNKIPTPHLSDADEAPLPLPAPSATPGPKPGPQSVPAGATAIAAAASQTPAAPAPTAAPPRVPPTNPASSAGATARLRISASPMGPMAAEAQALFADQTDGQLTQGSASAIHNVPNAPMEPPAGAQANAAALTQYQIAGYTPSAEPAAAASAPDQQAQPASTAPATGVAAPAAPQNCAPTVKCVPAKPPAHHAARPKAKPQAAPAPAPATETLGQAPAAPPQTAAPDSAQGELQQAPSAPATGTGLTDDELEQRNLPPLRGPWVRIQRKTTPVSPRDEAESQLHAIESSYSPWMGGNGVINYRSGSLGYDHLSALEAPFELSTPLGYNARLTIVAKPVFLDSGQADGTSTITVQESTTAGTQLVSIPQPIGTLTATDTTIPAQQNAVGIGGEAQLAFPHLAIAGGYTPAGFLVATFTARAYWKPGNGPFTFNFSRDPVRDTQLSYAGLRDPAGDSLANQGQIWGGVVANQGQVQFARGDAQSGYYVGAGGQYLGGYMVETNTRIDGSGGAYWRLKTMPEYGSLSIGANFFGMHYAHNEDAFTHGMGGYFSPQSYFLANVPFTWTAHYGTRWHYNLLGSLGVQAFQEDMAPLWPLAVDKPLETEFSNAMLPAKTSVGPNYDLRTTAAYQIGPHWFAGGFLSANNSRNYSAVNAGFSIHYLFRAQPSTATTPTGLFPTDGVRPFSVP